MQAGVLFWTVILPVLLIVAGGAVVQRFHRLEMQTLSKMQIYLFVPVFLFYYVYTSKLSLRDMAGIAVVALISQLVLAIPAVADPEADAGEAGDAFRRAPVGGHL